MENNSTRKMVVGLDIGTTKIAAVIGYRNENGQIDVIGHGKSVSTGVQQGEIQNIDKTVEGILSSIRLASQRANVDVCEVYVGIAGHHIKSNSYTHHHFRNGSRETISREELETMQQEVFNATVPPGENIVDVIPQRYVIDNRRQSGNPAGELGNEITGVYQVITGQKEEIDKIRMCTDKSDLRIIEIILEPIASSLACLTEEDKKQGVALVDIGGGTTDLIIYMDGNPVYTKVIALGGDSITRDIAGVCKVSKDVAEKLKIQHGTCIVQKSHANKIITIPNPFGQPIQIDESYLAQIIYARMGRNIVSALKTEIENTGLKDYLRNGVVLTGGGSSLRDLRELCNYELQLPARIGVPGNGFARDIPQELKQPSYATALGLLKYGIELEEANVDEFEDEPKPNPVNPFIHKDKKNNRKSVWGIFDKVRDYLKRQVEQVS